MIKALFVLIKRDLKIGVQKRAELLTPLAFFLMVITLFPLGMGLEKDNALRVSAPAILWVSALLSTLLIMDRLFKDDYEDGALEQLVISGQPLYLIVFGKIIAHWLLTGLPLVLFAPIMGLLLLFSFEESLIIGGILLVGTPLLSLIGAMIVAIVVSVRKAGILLSILILPLYIPVLIFGVQMILRMVEGHSLIGYFLIFLAGNVVAVVLCPLVAAAAIRLSLD